MKFVSTVLGGCAVILGASGLVAASAQAPAIAQIGEFEWKAAFVFRLTSFTEWPSASFAQPDSPIVIGVYGTESIATALEGVVRGESVNGHPLQVARVQNAEAAKGCHVLYVSGRDDRSETTLLNALKGRPVLTVGDRERFLDRGGMIYLTRTTTDKGRLQVNRLSYVRACGLNLAARLLRLADVRPEAE